MPARHSKQATKRATTKQKTTRKAKDASKASTATRQRRPVAPKAKPKASWKIVSESTQKFVLHTFDSGVRLVTHKVPDAMYNEVKDVLMGARNQVAASLGSLYVPPSQHDYTRMSATLTNLRETKEQLEERQAALTKTLESQEKELETLEERKRHLQNFGKIPGKHHPLLLEPLENELHLNFNTVK